MKYHIFFKGVHVKTVTKTLSYADIKEYPHRTFVYDVELKQWKRIQHMNMTVRAKLIPTPQISKNLRLQALILN